MKYGTGWHWQSLGDGRAALVPLSTAYECPSISWHHAETCAVDRIDGFGCTCKTTEEKTNDGEA